jgi:acetate kinase
MRLLVVNAGSSSTKCSILEAGEPIHGEKGASNKTSQAPQTNVGGDLGNADNAETKWSELEKRNLPPPCDPAVEKGLAKLLEEFPLDATVHRIVHGGSLFTGAVMLDSVKEDQLGALGDLAPLHNPPALALVKSISELAPRLPAVACFDTAFFAHLPRAAATYAVPSKWRESFGIRRFGFHGLSHQWASRQAIRLIAGHHQRSAETSASQGAPHGPGELRVLSAHLGSGASLAAIRGSFPVDTTMGFTPLEGLVMSTRSGSLDPGILLHLMTKEGFDAGTINQELEQESGLLGLSGSGDLREVIERALKGEEPFGLAWEVYLHRLVTLSGAMVAAMGGLDAMVFTGGAGEASWVLREKVCERLSFLGVGISERANREGTGDRVISLQASAPTVAVIRAREDLVMAEQAANLLGSKGGKP